MPPTPPGLVPYAGPALQDPYGETLLQMMQNQSERQYEHAMREAQRSADKWGAGSDFIGSLYPAYLQQQERQRAEVDRQRAEQDRLLNRREQEARIREAKRVAEREGRVDLRAADVRRLASVTNIPLEEQRSLAHGQLPSTQYGPVVDERGQVSLGPGVTIPAKSAAMPELRPMGGGYGLPIRSLVEGEDPVYERARTFEEVNRLELERAQTAADVAAAEVEARREAARLTAEHRRLQEENRAKEAQLTLNFRTASIENQQSPSEATFRRLKESASEGIKALYKRNALNPGSPSTLTDALEEWGNELRRNNFSEPEIKSVIGTSRQSVIDEMYQLEEEAWTDKQLSEMDAADVFVGMTAPVPPAEWKADTYRRISAAVDPPAVSDGPTSGAREPGPPPVPNLREIVEDALQPGKWPRQDVSAQVAEFKETYRFDATEEAIDLYRDVDKAVKSILKTVGSPEDTPVSFGRGYLGTYRTFTPEEKLEMKLERVLTEEDKARRHAQAVSNAVNSYFGTLAPTP